MDKAQLIENIIELAKQEGKTAWEVLTALQSGAAFSDDDELLDILCEIKADVLLSPDYNSGDDLTEALRGILDEASAPGAPLG